MIKKKLGNVKVKSMNGKVADIPEDCGYDKKFKYDIDMNSNGIMGDCIEWCQLNCEGKWGWWFEHPSHMTVDGHNWEDQDAYMSFEKKKDATKFWMSVGIVNMGNK